MTKNALNALLEVKPKFDLVGPTVADDIRRAIFRYGAEAVKAAVKEATKPKRGRKPVEDWPELRETYKADALDWLRGGDPFKRRTNYAIAKALTQKATQGDPVSHYKRIARKLSNKSRGRKWWTLVFAELVSSTDYPHEAHLRTLDALASLPKATKPAAWQARLENARATISDDEAREGNSPPKEMTFKEIEEAVQRGSIAALVAPPPPKGLFGR